MYPGPIAQRADGNVIAPGKFLLREAESTAQGLGARHFARTLKFFLGHRPCIGIGGSSRRDLSFGTTTASGAANSQETSYSYSVYLQDEWKALDKLTINCGARLDIVHGFTKGGQLSPLTGHADLPHPALAS